MSTIHNTLIGSELHYSKIKTGSGSPNVNSFALAANAWVGDIYLDLDTSSLYVRKGLTGVNDWVSTPIQHIGNNPIIFTTTGAVSVTLPTSGTLLSTTSTIPYNLLSLAGTVVNSDISPTANIALSKLAPLNVSRAVATDSSGVIVAASTTATELNYLTGVTSNVQNQLNAKQGTGNYVTSMTGNVTASIVTGIANTTIQPGAVTNSMLAGSIAYSKLILSGAILNSDLAGSIAYSKLALTGAILNADLAGSIADTKLLTISTAGKVANSATTASSTSGANLIVARDATGSFSANNLTLGGTLTTSGALSATAITTSGAANLGNSSSIAHTLQGAQTSSAQVNIINNATGLDAAGLKVSLPNDTTSSSIIQEWVSGVVRRGSVDGAGKFVIGAVGGTQVHTINGSATATVALTTPIINVTNYEEFSGVSTPATPAFNKVRIYAKADKKIYSLDDSGTETLIGGGSGISALTGDVTASGSGSVVATIANSAITDAKVSASANIQYSKLNLFGAVVNNDISASAGITLSKLAAMTASRVAVSDTSGFLTPSTITTTQLGRVSFLDGVTSDVQTQLNSKQASGNYVTSITGNVSATIASGVATTTIQPGVVTNAMIVASAGIPYSKLTLTNSIVGGDIVNGTIPDAKLVTITTAGKVSNSATTATNSNTASTIMARGTSGEFSAGSATLTGLSASTGTITTMASTTTTTDTIGIANYEEFTNLSVIPGTPAAGKVRVYTKTDKKLYMKNDAGTESEVGASTALTGIIGHVVATGPGSASSVIQDGVVTNAMLAGSIENSKLSTITAAGKVSNSATTADASASANTIVLRDFSGSIAAYAGTFSGGITAASLSAPFGNITNYEDYTEVAAPSTPSAGKVRIYAKTDKKMYRKDSSGVETELGGSSGAITSLTGVVTASGPGAAATSITAGGITNTMIATAAGIPYSKLTLTGTIVDADVSASAAIVDTKLATIATAGKVSNSATTATSSNNASTIVARDASGNINVGNITTKVATLGDIFSAAHTIQGGATSGYQVAVISNGVGGSGLSVKTDSGGTGTNLQVWTGGPSTKAIIRSDGQATFGDTSSGFHTLQGAQAADSQVKITNTNATNGSGLRVQSGTNTTATTVQSWFGSGTAVGNVNGLGSWTFGPASGFAGVLSHLFNGGISIVGNIVGTEPAANKTMLDNNLGAARLFACGPDTSTNGTFLFQSLRSNGIGGINTASTDTAGAWSFAVSTSTPISNVTNYEEFTEVTAPSTPSSGKLRIYAKSDKKLYTKDATGLEKAIGSGSGGSLNYIANPDAEAGTTGWAVTGTCVIAASATNKIRGTQSFLLTVGDFSGNSHVYTALFNPGTGTNVIDSRDVSSTLKIKFDFNNLGAAGDWKVRIYDNTALAFIDPSVTSVPGGKGTFEAVFATNTNTSYSLYFTRVAGTSGFHIDSVFVGPQEVIIGPAITDTIITTDITTGGFGTSPSVTSTYVRRGSSALIRSTVKITNLTGIGGFTFFLPSSLTIDLARLPNQNGGFGGPNNWVGYCSIVDVTTGALYKGRCLATNSNTITLYGGNGQVSWGVSGGTHTPLTMTTNMSISVELDVPISNWTSNLQIANNNVEFAFNNSTSTTDDFTSFGYGPQGVPFYAYAPSGLNIVQKQVRFQTPVQPTDVITLEVFLPSRGWMAAADSGIKLDTNDANTISYGISWFRTTSGTTDAMVLFYSRANRDNPWSSYVNGSWRLRKSSGVNVNALVGDRIGVTDGSAAAAGYVGQVISATPGANVNAGGTNAYFNVTSIALTAGDWDVSGTVVFAGNGATTTSSLWVAAISVNAPNSIDTAGGNSLTAIPMVGGTQSLYLATPTRRVTITGAGTTTVYLTARLTYSAGTPQATTESHISARRMR